MNNSYLLRGALIVGIPVLGIKAQNAFDIPPTKRQFLGAMCLLVICQVILASRSLPSDLLAVVASASIGGVVLFSRDVYLLLKRS